MNRVLLSVSQKEVIFPVTGWGISDTCLARGFGREYSGNCIYPHAARADIKQMSVSSCGEQRNCDVEEVFGISAVLLICRKQWSFAAREPAKSSQFYRRVERTFSEQQGI
ncbi:MAG: hypothetical protein ACYTGS_21340 [Planctomycetota bacterium]